MLGQGIIEVNGLVTKVAELVAEWMFFLLHSQQRQSLYQNTKRNS